MSKEDERSVNDATRQARKKVIDKLATYIGSYMYRQTNSPEPIERTWIKVLEMRNDALLIARYTLCTPHYYSEEDVVRAWESPFVGLHLRVIIPHQITALHGGVFENYRIITEEEFIEGRNFVVDIQNDNGGNWSSLSKNAMTPSLNQLFRS